MKFLIGLFSLFCAGSVFATTTPNNTQMIIRFNANQCCQNVQNFQANLAWASEQVGVKLELLHPMALHAYVIDVPLAEQQRLQITSSTAQQALRAEIIEKLKRLPQVNL